MIQKGEIFKEKQCISKIKIQFYYFKAFSAAITAW